MFLVANIDGITILQMLFRDLYCQFWEFSQVFQVFFFFVFVFVTVVVLGVVCFAGYTDKLMDQQSNLKYTLHHEFPILLKIRLEGYLK